MQECEAKGDFSHSEKWHICDKCRCPNVAGFGTKGDYWGVGENAGHFGVGWCYIHEKTKSRKRHALTYARRHMQAVQKFGSSNAALDGFEYKKMAEMQAEEAKSQIEMRDGIDLVRNTLEKFKESCSEANLLEYQNRALVPASDVTRIKLALEIAKTLSGLLKDKVYIDSTSYLHVDDVKIRVVRTIQLVEQYILNNTMRGEFLNRYKEIWGNIKPVSRRE